MPKATLAARPSSRDSPTHREADARARLHGGGIEPRTKPGLTLLLPVAALLLPLLILGVGAKLAWDSNRLRAEAELGRAAEAGAEYAARALNSYAIAAGRINDRMRALDGAPFNEAEAHRQVGSVVDELRQGVVSFVVDRDGMPLAASHLFPVPKAPLRDRDYFQALSQPNAPELHLGEMLVGRFDGLLFVALSRARRHSDGSFDGLTTISIDPNSLAEGLTRLLAAPRDTLALVRRDGAMLSLSSGQSAPLPGMPAGSPFHRFATADARQAVFEAAQGPLGAPGLVAMVRVADFPVYAIAARPLASVRSEWLQGIASQLLFGVPATLLLVLLSMLVRRQERELAGLNAALERDVERAADRLGRAQRYALVGAFEVDLQTGASWRSAEYMAVHGQAPEPKRERHADWLRRIHPDDRARAEAFLVSALADPAQLEYAQTYRIVTPPGEVRWISARGRIERGADGIARVMRGVHVDVTSLRSTELALAESDERMRLAQQAVGIGNWEWSPALRQLHLTGRALQLLGFPPQGSQPGWRAVLSRIVPDDRRRVRREVAAAFASGELRSEFRLVQAAAAPPAEPLWLVARGRVVPRPDGRGLRLLGVAYDVTDRKLAERRSELLAREVEHRAKNAMTLVLGLIRITRGDTHEAFVETLEDRVRSLSRTIGLLGLTRWNGASIARLLAQELEAFVQGDAQQAGRVQLAGPEVILGADLAQSLSMALHELVTNAAKYGALSTEHGRLSVTWEVRDGTLRLVWCERGGPPLTGQPPTLGFGSFLIRSSLEQQLGGRLTKRWEPAGLVCEISFPLPTQP